MKNSATIALVLLAGAIYAQDTVKPLTYRYFEVEEAAERVVSMTALPSDPLPRWARDVSQKEFDWTKQANKEPFFSGPIPFVIPPTDKDEPFYPHNHQPSITWLKNGDLLAIWYSTNSEYGPILSVVASRLRPGRKTWDPANVFFKVHNHNMHGSSIFHDGRGTIYHFNGMAPNAATGWRKLALLMRTSKDNAVTWTTPRAIDDRFVARHQVISGMFMTENGALIQNCDAVPGGNGGSALHISRDGGKTWTDPGEGKPRPTFKEGETGEGTIAGIHAKVVELADGRLLAFGRGDGINGKMPMSISTDLGKTWTYKASTFPPISGGQRLVLKRLQEGPLLFASFTSSRSKPEANGMTFTDQKGKEFTGHGLYAAVSFDEGKTWPVRKLLTPGKGDFDGGAWTKKFTATPTRAEHGGYLAATQTPDGEIHLISSRLHYRFNLPWLVVGTVTAAPSVNKQVRAEIKNPAPVRAVTRGPKFHWFGYYDKLQFDPSGRYLLSMEVDFEHRSPKADDVINVGMVDLKDKDTWIELGKTRAWCWQQGCMLQWRPGSDSEVLYNDREGDNFVCRIVDIKTRKTRTIPRAIYHLSPCGKFAITADFRRIQDMRPGYGYAGIPDPCKDELAPDKSGIWRVGLDSGKSKFLFSIADVVKIPKPGAVPSDAKHYFNHIECSTDGNRFVFLHRWRMLSGRGSFITRMLSANSDGSDIRLVSSNGGVSHFIWRDPEHISIWHTGAYRLYKDDGSCENTVQWEADNGHQSYLPDTNNEWLISDTYARGRNREIVPYLYHLTSKRVVPLGGFSQPRKYQGEWRCDSHPRFSPDGRTICIDSPHKGNGRQLYLMDISGIIGK